MEICCEAKELEQLTKIVKATINPRLPLTYCVTIETKGNEVIVRATDLKTMIIAKLNAIVHRGGQVNIPLQTLSSFIKREKGKVTIEEHEGKVNLWGHLTRLQLPLSGRIYSATPVPETGKCRLNLGSEFSRKVGWIWPYSMADDCRRPILETVCISQNEGNLVMAAADGFRLITVNMTGASELSEDSCPDFRINVPRKCCQLISKFLSGQVRMGRNEEREWFQTDKLTIISQL